MTNTKMSLELHDELKDGLRMTADEALRDAEDRYDEAAYTCKGCDGLGHSVEYCPLNRYF
jgi:uncharacterized hydantoinase/oxoprolinase family protein